MQEKIITLDNQSNEGMSKVDSSPVNYYDAEALVINDYSELSRHMVLGTAFRSKQPRIMYVKKGSSVHNVNLQDYTISEGCLMFSPINSIFSVSEVSKDFQPLVMSFDVANTWMDYDVLCLKLSPQNRKMVESYFRLSEAVITSLEDRHKALECIFLSLLYAIQEISKEQGPAMPAQKVPAALNLKKRFLRLLITDGGVRHEISYYAGKLEISANYLSIVIKKETGMSVQQWCRQRTVMEARIRLSETNGTITETASALGFCNATQFGTFFKKETGKTPMEYRNGIGM